MLTSNISIFYLFLSNIFLIILNYFLFSYFLSFIYLTLSSFLTPFFFF